MKIAIPLKALSINACFQGRRFKTPAYRQYDKALDIYLLPFRRDIVRCDWYEVFYKFYLKNFGLCDADNCVKALSDGLVRNGFLWDDRRIKRFHVEKFKSPVDLIEVEIVPYVEDK